MAVGVGEGGQLAVGIVGIAGDAAQCIRALHQVGVGIIGKRRGAAQRIGEGEQVVAAVVGHGRRDEPSVSVMTVVLPRSS